MDTKSKFADVGHWGRMSLGAEWDRSVRREQLSTLVRMTPYLSVVCVCNAVLLSIILSDSVPARYLLSWATGTILVALFMVANWWRNMNSGRAASGSVRAIRRATIYALVVGLTWASAAPLFFPFIAYEDRVFLSIVLSGMIAGGAISLASVPRACAAFTLPLVVVVMAFVIAGGNAEHLALAAMLALFFATTTMALRETPSAVSANAASKYARGLLSEFMDMIPQGMALFDSNDRLFLYNDSYGSALPQGQDSISPGTTFEALTRSIAEQGAAAEASQDVDTYVAERMTSHQNPGSPFEHRSSEGRWFRTHERRLEDASTIVVHEEITARKTVEQALTESEERFRDFAVSSADWFWELDSDLRFSYLSPNVLHAIDTPIEWYYGKSWEELLGEEYDRETWDPHLEELKARRPFRDFVYWATDDHGNGRWLSGSGRPFFDDDGNFMGYRGIGRDVSEQQQAKIDAEEAHKRLSVALESMDQGFVLYDEADDFVLCNGKFREINIAYSRFLQPGYSFEDLFNAINGNRWLSDPSEQQKWLEERMILHRTDNTSFVEMHHDGRWFRVDETRTPDGWYVGLRTDISEQKAAETELRHSSERFRLIAEKIAVPVVITRKSDGVILFANQASANFVDTSRENIIGRTLERNWIAPEDYQRFQAELDRVGQVSDFEVVVRLPKGAERTVLISVVDTGFAGEQALFINFIDITERKNAENAVRKSEEQTRLLLESSPMGVSVTDLERSGEEIVAKRLFVNEAFVDMMGLSSSKEMIDNQIASSWIDQDRLRFANEIMADGRDLVDFEALRQRPDGSEWWVSMNSRPVQFEGKERTVVWHFDITQRKKAEQTLRHSEEKYRDLVDGSIQGVIVHQNDRIVYANSAAANIYGYDLDELTGLPIERLLPEDQTEKLRTFRNRRTEGHIEFQALRKDGTKRWIEGFARNINWDGDPARQTTFVDTDVRRKALDDLAASEHRLAAAQAMSHVGSRETYLDSDELICSDEVYNIFGLPHDGRILSAESLSAAIHPDDRQRVEQTISQAQGHKDPYHIEYRIIRPDGGERWIEERGEAMFGDDDKPLKVFATVQDITERKTAEETRQRFLYAIENISEGFAVFDPEDRLVICNRPYQVSANAGTGSLKPGTTFETIIRESLKRNDFEDAGEDPEAWIAARLAHHRDPESELEFVKNGRNLLIRERRLPDDSTVLSITDLTELRQREAQLRQSQKMEAVGQLTSGIAHDFNNLLTAVIGNLALMEIRLADDEVSQRHLSVALRASRRGAELIQQLLSFSRRQVLSPTIVDVNSIIPGFRHFVRQALSEDIDIEIGLSDNLWTVMVDQTQLENALLNLVFNARDAMTPRGGRLSIETSNMTLDDGDADRYQEASAGDYVVVAITDTGDGMTEAVKSQAFDPFFTTKGVGEGTGLGLSMVFGFARQSGGHVDLDSAPGKGTTVRLFLPRSNGDDILQPEEDQNRKATLPGGDETIFVVEDEEDVRTFVIDLLQSLGYRVLSAADGPATLANLEEVGHVDLLLSDVVLPGGINGAELAEEFLRRHEDGKVLLSSGYPRDLLDKRGVVIEGIDLLMKPYRVEELARRVRQSLEN
jgi:PAS domain S-box-containing protein